MPTWNPGEKALRVQHQETEPQSSTRLLRTPWRSGGRSFACCFWSSSSRRFSLRLRLSGVVAYDQNHFHLVPIRSFAAQWPGDLIFRLPSRPPRPWYHVILATVYRFVSHDLRVLKLTGTLFPWGWIATLGIVTARVRRMACGDYPFIAARLCSIYILSSRGSAASARDKHRGSGACWEFC